VVKANKCSIQFSFLKRVSGNLAIEDVEILVEPGNNVPAFLVGQYVGIEALGKCVERGHRILSCMVSGHRV
jgi:hypothetical protein